MSNLRPAQEEYDKSMNLYGDWTEDFGLVANGANVDESQVVWVADDGAVVVRREDVAEDTEE